MYIFELVCRPLTMCGLVWIQTWARSSCCFKVIKDECSTIIPPWKKKNSKPKWPWYSSPWHVAVDFSSQLYIYRSHSSYFKIQLLAWRASYQATKKGLVSNNVKHLPARTLCHFYSYNLDKAKLAVCLSEAKTFKLIFKWNFKAILESYGLDSWISI